MPGIVVDKADTSNLPPVPITWRLVVLALFCSVGGESVAVLEFRFFD